MTTAPEAQKVRRRRRDRRGVTNQRFAKEEFLPAALEVVETPPSPIGRAISLTIVGALCLTLVWAYFARVDIISSAPGKIEPNGQSKIVQPLESGVVRTILVHEGQSVKKGDALIDLDATNSNADTTHVAGDLLAVQLEIARINAALSESSDPIDSFSPPPGATPDQMATQRQLLLDQTKEQRAKVAALDRQAAQKQAERDAAMAAADKVSGALPFLRKQVGIRKELFDNGLESKITYLQVQQDLAEHQQELNVQKGRVKEAEAALAAVAQARDQTIAEYRANLLKELAVAEQKAGGLSQDLIKANEKRRLQTLRAPVQGVVQQLAVHTIGGVVTPAEPLMVIVPEDSPLEVEARISNQDIGFVRPGQEVAIKVQTYNFTQYGLISGRVINISRDAILQDGASPTAARSSEMSGGRPAIAADKELIYSARISLDRTTMVVDGQAVKLMPGMVVTADIKTGSRRVLDYLLSPLLRLSQESLHER